MFRPVLFSIILATSALGASSFASAQDQSPAFSWTLPKTVLDVSVTYDYAGCVMAGGNRQYRIKVTPLVAARGIADPVAGWRIQPTGDLRANWKDRNLTIATFANSHILNTVSAHPVGQAATIINNVLGGIGKIVGIAIGAAPLAADAATGATDCPDDVNNPGHQITTYKGQIQKVQEKLAGDNVSDSQQKQYTAQLQALQTLLQQEQARMTFTIKATIDPGYIDPKNVQVGSDAPALPFPSQLPPGSPKLGAVPQNGLIASLIPTAAQTKGVPWIKDTDPVVAPLKVSVYMGFVNSIPSKQAVGGYYLPTIVGSHPSAVTYRDVAYIPVLVRLGDAPNGELLANNKFPFAQYGQEQVLPLGVSAFGDVNWSMTFSELGEETNSSFASKSFVLSASSVFTPAASAASSIASELRPSNPNSANALQAQADAIYQAHRLAVCQADPANCASK